MLDCISVENMRRSDALTIQRYVPSLELMGRAAMGVFLATAWKGPVAIVAGSGNNGGDGFALACILQEKKIDCTVFTLRWWIPGLQRACPPPGPGLLRDEYPDTDS